MGRRPGAARRLRGRRPARSGGTGGAGVFVPAGLTIQRSTFRDDRPTLFCIVKHLPHGLLWEKVTVTFDNPSGGPALFYKDMVRGVRSTADMI
ncbi:hypothetical protein GCM10025734_82300 [Kitasatospora paranensis]